MISVQHVLQNGMPAEEVISSLQYSKERADDSSIHSRMSP
jgi:hypothetical protein